MTTQTRAGVRTGDEAAEELACGLCGSRQATQLLTPNTAEADWQPEALACTNLGLARHGRIVRCDNCGLVYASPRPTAEQIDALYSAVEDDTYLREEEARVATFRHSLLKLRPHAPGGRLLDVGCHVGTFLQVARAGGYEVVGVEPSAWAASIAHSRGLDVHTGGVADARLEAESFDVVTVWDVIEHLSDPLGELEKIRRLLVPGGVIALSTMDVGSPLPRVMKGRWPWYMLMHLYYFTPRTLGAMLERAGYEVIRTEPHIRVVHVRYLASKLGAYSAPASRLATVVTERLGLTGVRVPVYLGDMMTMYARKR